MAIDLLAKFSVTDKVDAQNGQDLFALFLLPGEQVLLNYKHSRDRVIFTSQKIIAVDVQGLTGKKKEFRIFPYNKISSFSVETSGTFDMDSDFKIWVSGVGLFSVKFGRKIDIKEIGRFLTERISG